MGRPPAWASRVGCVDATQLCTRSVAVREGYRDYTLHCDDAGVIVFAWRCIVVARSPPGKRILQAEARAPYGDFRGDSKPARRGAVRTGHRDAGRRSAHPRRLRAMSFDPFLSTSICYGTGAPDAGWTLALPITLPLLAIAALYLIGAT